MVHFNEKITSPSSFAELLWDSPLEQSLDRKITPLFPPSVAHRTAEAKNRSSTFPRRHYP